MAVLVITPNPQALWDAFVKAIGDNTVRTWVFHDDGVHFTHKSEQWGRRAWFRAEINPGMITFNIVKTKGRSLEIEVYAEYHALLLRVLLADFDKRFSNAIVTALANLGDIVAERD
jgi:hypothetical protein